MKPKRNTSINPWVYLTLFCRGIQTDVIDSVDSRFDVSLQSSRVMLLIVLLCHWLHTPINYVKFQAFLPSRRSGIAEARAAPCFLCHSSPPYLSLAEQYGREITQLATVHHLTIIVGSCHGYRLCTGARSKINMLQKSQAPVRRIYYFVRRTEDRIPSKESLHDNEGYDREPDHCITNWGDKKDETQTSSSYGSEFSIHSFILLEYGGWMWLADWQLSRNPPRHSFCLHVHACTHKCMCIYGSGHSITSGFGRSPWSLNFLCRTIGRVCSTVHTYVVVRMEYSTKQSVVNGWISVRRVHSPGCRLCNRQHYLLLCPPCARLIIIFGNSNQHFSPADWIGLYLPRGAMDLAVSITIPVLPRASKGALL